MDKNGLSSFLLGLGVGIGIGMLFAPKAGADTRQLIKDKTGEGADYLKQRSTDRMNEVTAKLKDVDASYEGVKNSFKPFTSDIKDIQTYLGTDLTAGGLNTIKDIVSKTKVDAVPLRDSIKQLQASFSGLSTALSPVMPGAEQK